MKSGRRPAGFTIIETLIVLAVTGAMLISAMALIAGKQRSTEFTQGVRLVQGQLQQTINEVSNGYYLNNGGFTCQQGVNGPVLSTVGGTAPAQGSNLGCIFFGKAIQFAAAPAGTEPEPYNVFTMVGLQDTEDDSASDLSAVKPLLLARDDSIRSGMPDIYDKLKMPFGMEVKSMYYGPDTAKVAIGAVGFASSVGNFGGDISGGLNVLAIRNTGLHQAVSTAVDKIDRSINPSYSTGNVVINPPEGVRICIDSGGTNQSVIYTIGAQGKNTSVESQIKSGACL